MNDYPRIEENSSWINKRIRQLYSPPENAVEVLSTNYIDIFFACINYNFLVRKYIPPIAKIHNTDINNGLSKF